jgi:hypothetical protein
LEGGQTFPDGLGWLDRQRLERRRLTSDIRTSDISLGVARNDNGVGADPSTPLLFLSPLGPMSDV